MKVAASGYRQRRKYGKPEARAVEPFDPGRQHIAVTALVGQQGQVRATAQRGDRTPRSDPTFWDQLALITAEPRDHAV